MGKNRSLSGWSLGLLFWQTIDWLRSSGLQFALWFFFQREKNAKKFIAY